ncbi:PhzF family phenazine biosynthesis protein [Pseudoduganella sp. LjRoot289]|uniref:PhzF family phenazine biosynthesis protein n=1 Tax=Pseudoduganella sp. LjRoot289 TaxID=3342314 RepID=UPI003ECDDEAC
MIIHKLKCFGGALGEGNAALVILGDNSSEYERQQFARAQNLSACVFVNASPQGEATHVLDYYYPHMRSQLCLHATLAAARVLLQERDGPLPVRTAMRGQLLLVSKNAAGVYVRLQRQPAPEVQVTPQMAAELLGKPGLALASAPVVASVGSPKLLIEVQDSATLQALHPDLQRIAAWGGAHAISGCYVYAQRADGSLEGRNFNHLDPALEDSATGVAAGALTLHLGRPLTLHQGAGTGQPCVLRTALDGESVLVGGAAVFAAGA